MKPTDPGELLANLNAGVFAQQIGRALSDVAAGVVDHGKAGEVTIKLSLKQIGESHQVSIDHKLSYLVPTKRGKRTEETSLKTPMYVTGDGLQLFQPSPTADMFSKDLEPEA